MCELEEGSGYSGACLAELVNKYNKQKDFMVRQHALSSKQYNKIFDRKFSHNFLHDYTLKFRRNDLFSFLQQSCLVQFGDMNQETLLDIRWLFG